MKKGPAGIRAARAATDYTARILDFATAEEDDFYAARVSYLAVVGVVKVLQAAREVAREAEAKQDYDRHFYAEQGARLDRAIASLNREDT